MFADCSNSLLLPRYTISLQFPSGMGSNSSFISGAVDDAHSQIFTSIGLYGVSVMCHVSISIACFYLSVSATSSGCFFHWSYPHPSFSLFLPYTVSLFRISFFFTSLAFFLLSYLLFVHLSCLSLMSLSSPIFRFSDFSSISLDVSFITDLSIFRFFVYLS